MAKNNNINNAGMEYFTIEELCYSQTASRRGITNVPNAEQIENLRNLTIQVLDPLRRKWGRAIHVNSGFRSQSLNRVVGGATGSQHTKGQAADISVNDRTSNKKLFNLIRESRVFDQLINENNYQWVHVSYNAKGNRRQVLEKVGKVYRVM